MQKKLVSGEHLDIKDLKRLPEYVFKSMAGYDQRLKVKTRFAQEARHFLNFLQKVGKKYPRPVRINYRYLGRGFFYIMVDGGTGGIDALFQELILNRGLYYYGCTLSNKKEIISFVIVPVFRQLIDERFSNPQSRFLRKHILGKYSQRDFVPTEIRNSHGYDFEILFRRWDLKIISNKDFVIGLDAIITNFILEKLGHKKGEKSSKFPKLIQNLKKEFILTLETEKNFQKIHKMRTGALHRLESPENTEELYDISTWLFHYFEYLDEFEESQLIKYVYGRSKKAKRYKYGTAVWKIGGKEFPESITASSKPCGDCGVTEEYLHVIGCDIELCPICGHQLLGCGHRTQI